MSFPRALFAGLLLFGLAANGFAQKSGLDDLLDTNKKPAAKPTAPGGIDDLLEGKGGGIRFRLVPVTPSQPPLAERLFWRTFQGTVAAETVPAEFRIDDQVIMATQFDSEADAEGAVAPLQATTGTAKLGTREQFLIPGKIPLKPQGGTFVANHPAIRTGTKTGDVNVLCAPVRFEFQDAAGCFVGTTMQIQCAGVSLLRKNPRITRMTMWLPVGLTYSTSFGNFGIAADGKLQLYGGLPPGVTRTELGFRKIVEADISRARPAPPSDITVMSTDKPYSVFVANRLTPGEPLWLAVSRPAYMNSNRVAPLASHFAQLHLNKVVAKAEDCAPPGQDVVQRAAAGLNAKPDQLAWYRVPWRGELGANRVTIDARFGGNFQQNVLVAEPSRGLYLVPHRLRTVFADTETPVYHVIVPAGFVGGTATIEAKRLAQDADDAKSTAPLALGHITLPAVTSGFDSRSFELRMSAIPSGRYSLVVRQGNRESQSVSLEVVEANRPRSPFFVHSMIWGNTWPESDEGLKAVHDAGVEMLIQGQTLEAVVPQIDSAWQAVLDRPETGPSELALQRTRNDMLLERLTRHQLKHVDFAVTRTAGFYNEGLSYHHSYQPSVDRMVQRLQIFTQQTVEYPSAAGINFSWFPQMYGYVEGGVPTDAHTKDRNRVLDENLAKAGFTQISREDRQWLQKNFASTNPADQQRARELEAQDIRYWKAAFEYGFGKHNEMYAKAIGEVKPQAIATLYENAGHDSGKRPDELFNGMSATSYFTMTDYGDWPMSAAFTTEWSRAMSGGKRPVWVTTEGLNTTEGQTKQLFHAFARGLDGGGYPMTDNKPIAELNRRGKVLNFLAQYGAIAKYARPDRRVAILATNAKHRFAGNGSYEYHSLFYHLTRLGYPPAIIAEDSLAKAGIGDETQVLALVNVDRPLTDNVVHAIQEFQKRGGRVVVFGAPVSQIADTIPSGAAITSIWQGPGFKWDTHVWLWQQFGEVKEKIADTIRKAGLEPLASCDPAHGFALTLNGNKIDYVVVVADQQGTHISEFGREAGLRVSVPCKEGYRVRDLRTQTDLEVVRKGDKAYVSVDLVTEPATILAVFQKTPEQTDVFGIFPHNLGGKLGTIPFSEFRDDEKKPKVEPDFAGWPLAWEWIDPNGNSEKVFGAYEKQITFSTPLLGKSGDWKLRCQELITGRDSEVKIPIAEPQQKVDVATPVSGVHFANAPHITGFLRRSGERLVLLEPGQEALQDIAENLVRRLNDRGVPARLWKLQPEDFDAQPNRWYMRPEDEARQSLIDAGKLVGYREQMKAYIDKLKAVHIPERGGYATAGPNFIVSQDAIVFSGGKLAESLRSVTAWMETPNVPGRGQGRLVVAFSPFAAGKQVLAIVGNDPQGLKLAAEEVVTQFGRSHTDTARSDAPSNHTMRLTNHTLKFDKTHPVPRPYDTLTPHRRVRELAANELGQAAVWLQDGGGVALVDEQGKVTAAVQDAELLATLDNQGQLWDVHQERTEKNTSIALRCIGPDGKLRFSLPAFSGNPATPGINAGFVAAPDGKRVALGQLGKVLIGSPLESAWNAYDDTPNAQERFAVFFPRMPIAAVFSPEGRYLCLSLDTRPPLNSMSGPLPTPTFAETICVDTQTGRRVWSLRDRTPRRSTYAVHRGFLAVSRDAKRVALADFEGGLYLVDEAGKELFARRPEKIDYTASSRLNPVDGIQVAIADNGSLAAFGFKQYVVLAADKNVVDVPLPGITSVCVTRSGSHAVVATEDGALKALEPDGTIRWTKDMATTGMQLAAAVDDRVFVGTGNGELLLVDGQGEVVRRTAVFETAKKIGQPAANADDTRKIDEPKIYSPPNTLDVAKRRLKAKQVASWQPAGATSESFGQKFYRVDGPLQLNAGDTTSGFLHLVYRRPLDSKVLKITITGSDGRETFDLDLATPTYRVVDLPLRGPKAQTTIEPTGSVEIAECSVWSVTWPSANLALVLASSPGEKKPKAVASADDLLADLTTGGVSNDISGRMKDCKIWWPNTDPDRVKGHFLAAPVDPLTMVDGVRFAGGRLQPWASGKSAIWGGSFTIDFGKPVELSLVATYDRVTKQSAVNSGIMLFTGAIKAEHDSPPTLTATIENDQFWRIFEFAPTKIQILGTHVYAGDAASGLSEVEAYR